MADTDDDKENVAMADTDDDKENGVKMAKLAPVKEITSKHSSIIHIVVRWASTEYDHINS